MNMKRIQKSINLYQHLQSFPNSPPLFGNYEELDKEDSKEQFLSICPGKIGKQQFYEEQQIVEVLQSNEVNEEFQEQCTQISSSSIIEQKIQEIFGQEKGKQLIHLPQQEKISFQEFHDPVASWMELYFSKVSNAPTFGMLHISNYKYQLLIDCLLHLLHLL